MPSSIRLESNTELRVANGPLTDAARRFSSPLEAQMWMRQFQGDPVLVRDVGGMLAASGGTVALLSGPEILSLAGSQLYLGVLALAATSRRIAWGAKVSADFKKKVLEISTHLGVDPDYLMACMAFESGESFSPSKANAAGSGATGLIQFMPATARALGTTTAALAKMTAVEQLDYVEKYFDPYRNRLKTLDDVYMAILWPAAIGRPDSYALFRSPSTAYTQNAGLDANKDGIVTKAEAAARVRAELHKGEQAGFVG